MVLKKVNNIAVKIVETDSGRPVYYVYDVTNQETRYPATYQVGAADVLSFMNEEHVRWATAAFEDKEGYDEIVACIVRQEKKYAQSIAARVYTFLDKGATV